MKYSEDHKVGDKYISRGRTITEADIVNFCMFSGDWYPAHSDAEWAKKSVFGERIAHGFLVLSAASGLFPLHETAIIAFYGMDKTRFVGAVKIGDTIRVEMEVTELKSKQEGGVVKNSCIVKNQKDEEVVVTSISAFVANGAPSA